MRARLTYARARVGVGVRVGVCGGGGKGARTVHPPPSLSMSQYTRNGDAGVPRWI
jgi:hypothetical protein